MKRYEEPKMPEKIQPEQTHRIGKVETTESKPLKRRRRWMARHVPKSKVESRRSKVPILGPWTLHLRSLILTAAVPPIVAVLSLFLLVTSSGCGTEVQNAIIQAGTAAGQTFLDNLFTELLNELAAQGDETTPPNDGDMPDDGDVTDGDDTTGNGAGLDDLMGDVTAGNAVFVDNGCASCHCDDATGGCALSAPSLIGVDLDTVDTFIRGSGSHPVKPPLTDQQIVDLSVYLASLP